MNETAEQISGAVAALIDEQGTTPLTREAAARLDEALASAASDESAARDVIGRLRASNHIVAHGHNTVAMYAAGALESAAGNPTAAHDAFTQLTGALERAEAWPGFVVAASRALELTSHPDFARCLARAWEKSGQDGVPAAVLVEASRVAPDDHRLRLAAGFALDREGQRIESERHIAAAVPGFIQKGEFSRIEEAYLRLLETEDPVVASAVLDALFLLTRQIGGGAAATYWEVASSFVDSKKMHDRVWAFFKEYLAKHPEHDVLRAAAFRAFRGVAVARGIPEEMIEAPGITSTRPLPEAIARTDLLLGWPTGLYVDHRFSGIGRVLANNCDMLRIEFTRATQEMSLEIAGRSLLKLDPADLRVRLAFDREGLSRDAAERPANLVHAALVMLRGEGTLPELKRTLVPNAVSLEAWTDFWRRAQKGMKDDLRFDLSQTVRKIYRIVDPAKRPALSLPQFDVKETLARRVDTLEKFLDENAELADAVKEAHGIAILRLFAKEPATSAPRLATTLLLLRLGAIGDDDARSIVAEYFAAHDEFPPSVAKDAQARTIALATGMENPTSVYLAGLSSRTKPVRDESLTLLAAHLGGGYLEFLLRLLVRSPARTPAVFHLVSQPELVKGWPSWDALLALVRIIAAPPRETHEKAALKELNENAALRAGLRDSEPVPETLETLRLELVRWKVSERLLMPILEMLEQVGRAEFAEDVRAARRAATGAKAAARARDDAAAAASVASAGGMSTGGGASARGGAQSGGGSRGDSPRDAHSHLTSFAGRILMSRAAYDRLGEEVRQVGLELKTSIPRAIEIARAHGDLRENAEYEAAKDKQRRYAARLTELEEKWNRALTLEPSMVAAGIIGPGTEITIEALDDGERSTYWILGEGDDIHGENVISYLAPLGKAFAGRRAGDEATVSAGGHERRYRVLSVEPKLP